MALMTFREPNQVRWGGFRPGHRGTQVLVDINVTDGTAVLIDGTQATITYLTDWSLGIIRNVDCVGQLFITTNGDVHVAYLAFVSSFTSDPGGVTSQALMYPIEIPAGYKVKVYSSGAGATVRGYIHGWEE